MLRVVSQNLNGIRSAARKGWFAWAATLNADAICVQEVRAHLADSRRLPARFADGRLRAGYLSLVPVTPASLFRAFIEVV